MHPYVFGLSINVQLSKSCEYDMYATIGGNSFKFGTNVILD